MEGRATANFADFLQYKVNLDALNKITSDLDNEIADSQQMMAQVKAMFDSIPKQNAEPVDNGLRHEDLSKFLEAGVPKLLLPDMTEDTTNFDLDSVIATLKVYTEDLKKNYSLNQSQRQDCFNQSQRQVSKDMQSLNLEEYAASLEQLGQRLSNIKLGKREGDNRNAELETKLGQLCLDVNMFTQIVQAKTTLSECNKNWPEMRQDNSSLRYDNIINKLLSGINEVTYLLQNKN